MSQGFDFSIAIGGAAGQGIATPGNILARMFVRRGLHLNAYNAYQSIIRGGHILLTMRVREQEALSHGDHIHLLLCLNQDTMTRHLRHLGPGAYAVYNADNITPGEHRDGVHLCGMPVTELTGDAKNKLAQNTAALGVIAHVLGLDFEVLESALTLQFQRKGEAVVSSNVAVARAGYEYSSANFTPLANPLPENPDPLAVWTGNDALAMGGAAAGVKFYCAYPMSPSTGVLHWMAKNARELGIMVRQVEDEIGVANMAVGAAHTGARTMCATSGGGFALMTEAIGSAAMMEIPVVFINVMRAGPSTGVPTKTEQGDLWQALGASQGDFERIVVAPQDAHDAFGTIAEVFNLVDRYQCPAIVLSDLLISEGTFSVPPDDIDMSPPIERGKLIRESNGDAGPYNRYVDTADGISPRAVPGVPGHVHVVATDEHDEEGILISDEFTNPIKRRQMVEKRARKLDDYLTRVAAPKVEGDEDPEVTLVGWGSTAGVIAEAMEQLRADGVKVNRLAVKWILPFHAEAVTEALSGARKTLIIENNHSGQFHRYLRSETGITADGHIRKYDGEPFMPHHIADGVRAHLAGNVADGVFVPDQEILV
ncbi:MAG: 2-oxoacid:acceptor oxidoreductase subunit alpha [Acidobacteria bacterium]|nr:2-oxoacid:acceptor oxidoreductase subunit alpha [Acidobacteriota bacterium]